MTTVYSIDNPVLIGEPGTGKTAVVEGLAQRIVNRDVPPNLLGRLWSLDMGAVMAGAKYKGTLAGRTGEVGVMEPDNFLPFSSQASTRSV